MGHNRFSLFTRLFCALFAFALITGCVATEDNNIEATNLSVKKKGKRGEKAEPRIVTHKSLPKKSRHRYFVEFRSRPNGATSHSYVAYGRLYSRGRIRNVKIAGLHPKNGSVGFLVGSIVGMDATVGPVWGDLNIPHTVSFRVPLDSKQYKKVVAFIKEEQKTTHTWNLVLNNCNGFVGRIAEIVGLQSGGATAVPPSSYVQSLIDVNT